MKIGIIDTQAANLNSVYQALNKLADNVIVTDNISTLNSCDKLILPGVGSAQSVMENIKSKNLEEFIVSTPKLLLGICLGMQILAQYSYEVFSNNEDKIKTLGVIEGDIKKLDTKGLVLPHMGWNTISFNDDIPLFKGIENNSYFYFVHSFALMVNKYTIASCTYGSPFSAAIGYKNFYAVQFHPEKSGKNGQLLLNNFVNM